VTGTVTLAMKSVLLAMDRGETLSGSSVGDGLLGPGESRILARTYQDLIRRGLIARVPNSWRGPSSLVSQWCLTGRGLAAVAKIKEEAA